MIKRITGVSATFIVLIGTIIGLLATSVAPPTAQAAVDTVTVEVLPGVVFTNDTFVLVATFNEAPTAGQTVTFDLGIGAAGIKTTTTDGTSTSFTSPVYTSPATPTTYNNVTASLSSPAIQSDPIAIAVIERPAPGQVTIAKATTPVSIQSFPFLSGKGNFSLQNGGDQVFTVDVFDSFIVREDLVDGWNLSISCVNDPAEISVQDFESDGEIVGKTFVVLQAGATAACTFNNSRQSGTLEVVKELVPTTDPGLFDLQLAPNFTTDIQNPVIVTDQPHDGTTLEQAVITGEYTVSEDGGIGTVLTDYDTSIVCEDGSGTLTGFDPPVEGTEATVTVNEGDNIVCTITNTAKPSITIAKETLPDGDPASFTFTPSANLSAAGDFTLSDGTTQLFDGLTAGETYTVSETVPTGWDLTDITCVSSITGSFSIANGGDLTPDPGEDITCTFTNTKQASITVDKVTDPTGDTASFEFTTTGLTPGTFNLTDGAEPVTFENLTPGETYTVSETVPSEWEDPASISCDSANATVGTNDVSIEPDPGEDITCTFTNTKQASITIDKVTDPTGDPASFTFVPSANLSGSNFTLTDADTPVTFENLTPDATYTVSETVPTGWELTDITCTTNLGAPFTIANGDDLTPAPGEAITCTFTNTKQASITIDKVTDPTGDPASFAFTATGLTPGTFNLTDGDSQLFENLTPGETYTVSESALTGWELTDITCDSTNATVGTDNVSIEPDPGEDIACTFTNTKQASITIAKETVPDGDTTSFTFTPSADLSAAGDFTLADGTTEPFENLTPDVAYSVSETVPDGWSLTDITCTTNLGAPFTIANGDDLIPAPGEDITCTFTNTKETTINIVKETLPDGSSQSFSFTAGNGLTGNFTLTDGQNNLFSPVTPGTGVNYTITETVPTGWQVSIVCESALGTSTFSTTPATGEAVINDLAEGDDVTCTFTNEQLATITVDKVTAPAGDTTLFEFTTTGLTPTTFSLQDADTPFTFDNLEPGSNYSISETIPAGWELTEYACTSTINGVTGEPVTYTNGATLTPQAGETLDCTFTNTKLASLTIVKDVFEDTNTQEFSFTSNISGNESFNLSDGGTSPSSLAISDLSPGVEYTITEGAVSGWALRGILCTTGGTATPNLETGALAVTLDPGADVTCTFTNEQTASLTLSKAGGTLTGDAATTQTFDFSVVASGGEPDSVNLGIGQDNSAAPLELLADTYSVTEVVPTGWTLEDVTCTGLAATPTNITDGVEIAIERGEDVTCTFTNSEQPAAINIGLTTAPAGLTGFPFSTNITGDATFTLDDGGTESRTNLASGTYNVSYTGTEDVSVQCTIDPAPGATTAQSSTSVGTNSVDITLAPGETVNCDFSNTPPGTLEVTKTVNWSGETPDPAQQFEICVTGPTYPTANCQTVGSSGGTLTWDNLFPGDYTVSETDPGEMWNVIIEATTVTVASGATATTGVTNTFITSARNIYLPFIATAPAGTPNLVVESITISPSNPDNAYTPTDDVVIEVTIANVGTAPNGAGFWADLYLDPNPIPAQNNMPLRWNDTCDEIDPLCVGIAWPVNATINPGETLTLSSQDIPDADRFSRWYGWLPTGTDMIYAYVDTWDVADGVVSESNEGDNRNQLDVTVTGENRPLPLSVEAIPERPALPPAPSE